MPRMERRRSLSEPIQASAMLPTSPERYLVKSTESRRRASSQNKSRAHPERSFSRFKTAAEALAESGGLFLIARIDDESTLRQLLPTSNSTKRDIGRFWCSRSAKQALR